MGRIYTVARRRILPYRCIGRGMVSRPNISSRAYTSLLRGSVRGVAGLLAIHMHALLGRATCPSVWRQPGYGTRCPARSLDQVSSRSPAPDEYGRYSMPDLPSDLFDGDDSYGFLDDVLDDPLDDRSWGEVYPGYEDDEDDIVEERPRRRDRRPGGIGGTVVGRRGSGDDDDDGYEPPKRKLRREFRDDPF